MFVGVVIDHSSITKYLSTRRRLLVRLSILKTLDIQQTRQYNLPSKCARCFPTQILLPPLPLLAILWPLAVPETDVDAHNYRQVLLPVIIPESVWETLYLQSTQENHYSLCGFLINSHGYHNPHNFHLNSFLIE